MSTVPATGTGAGRAAARPGLGAATHANLVEFSRRSAGWSAAGRRAEAAGVLLYATGASVAQNCNGAFRLDPALPAGDVIARADDFFAALGRPYALRLRTTAEDDDLRDACRRGRFLFLGGGAPHMVCSALPPDDGPGPPGLAITAARSAGDVRRFAAACAAAYATSGMPPHEVLAVFDRPQRVVDDAAVTTLVATVDGEVAGGAQVVVAGGSAGIYWVATVPGQRGRGVGTALARRAAELALASAPVAALQASPMGAPLYRRLGFEELYRYETYVRPPPRRSRGRRAPASGRGRP